MGPSVMRNSAANRRSPLGLFPGQPTPRLYDRVVEALRTRHYSRRTEEAYLHWIRRFLASHNGTHPREMAEMEVNRFLMWARHNCTPSIPSCRCGQATSLLEPCL